MRSQTLGRALVATITLAAALVLAGQLAPPPASAATKAAGIPGLTPDGGYLGNYLAPDGAKVYCIDSPLPWPEGETSGPALVDTVVTTWGSPLPAESLRKLNYVLLRYGETDDPVQAAAVAAFVNAYTSGWARDLGAGYAAGAWYLNGNATVTAVYDAIWGDAEANALPVGTASVQITMADATTGSVTVSASLLDAVGTLVLHNAVSAATGESAVAVTAAQEVPIVGVPGDDALEYAVSAEVSYTAPAGGEANLLLYTTPEQQRTIRAGTPASLAFAASAQTEALRLPPRLAATGDETAATAVAGAGLVIVGALLGISARRRRWA